MCPLQMQVMANALRTLPSDSSGQFRVVFVTTDPERDNPVALRSWLDHFDKRFIGLTGSQAAIDAAPSCIGSSPSEEIGSERRWDL